MLAMTLVLLLLCATVWVQITFGIFFSNWKPAVGMILMRTLRVLVGMFARGLTLLYF